MIKKISIILVLLFFIASYAGAATFYIDDSGSTAHLHEKSTHLFSSAKLRVFFIDSEYSADEIYSNGEQVLFSEPVLIYSNYEHSDFLERAPPA